MAKVGRASYPASPTFGARPEAAGCSRTRRDTEIMSANDLELAGETSQCRGWSGGRRPMNAVEAAAMAQGKRQVAHARILLRRIRRVYGRSISIGQP